MHRRKRHRQRFGEVAHRGRTARQALHNGAARGVGQRAKRSVQGWLIVKHVLKYWHFAAPVKGRLTWACRHGNQPRMYLWAGLVLIALGLAALATDRWSIHVIYDHVSGPMHRFLDSITHLAKAGHWLLAAVLAYGLARLFRLFLLHDPRVFLAQDAALAFIASLALGSLALHILKRLVGRRRPRDEIEMHLYEFKLWTFKSDYNSLPSGHALTIFAVAAILTCIWPMLAALWFAIAAFLSTTRVLLTAHFVSDVLIGAGMGLISTHIVLVHFFTRFAPNWV